MEKDLFKEDLKNRTIIWNGKGYKISTFSSELQSVVQHPDILVEYNKSHSSVNTLRNYQSIH